jgi:hypothetical protein
MVQIFEPFPEIHKSDLSQARAIVNHPRELAFALLWRPILPRKTAVSPEKGVSGPLFSL